MNFKLKKDNKSGEGRKFYKQCTNEEKLSINQKALNDAPEHYSPTNVKTWLQNLTQTLPTEPKKDKFKFHKTSNEAQQILDERQLAADNKKHLKICRTLQKIHKAKSRGSKEKHC